LAVNAVVVGTVTAEALAPFAMDKSELRIVSPFFNILTVSAAPVGAVPTNAVQLTSVQDTGGYHRRVPVVTYAGPGSDEDTSYVEDALIHAVPLLVSTFPDALGVTAVM
jgi:hypothetical protein